jgi:hypothetical protein
MQSQAMNGNAGDPVDPRPLTVDDVVRIATYQDRSPTREAMVVAFCYHRLAAELARKVGSEVNSWYCHAAWGSKAVGERLDLTKDSPFLSEIGCRLRVPGPLSRPFRTLVITLLGPSYQLGLALANRAIFLETGSLAADLWGNGRDFCLLVTPDAARPEERQTELPAGSAERPEGQAERPYYDVLADRALPDEERRPAFVSSLLAPADDTYLDRVVHLLGEAAETDDPALRAELILGANVALVAYEQQRVQRLLELVVYRPPRWLLRICGRSLWSVLTRRPFPRFWLYTTPHERQPRWVRWIEGRWAKFYTRFLLSMRTPVSAIRLGKPLLPPAGVDAGAVVAPIRHAAVRELVEGFVPDPERALAGVSNWLDYHDRMRFIVGYFRMYHPVQELFACPFDPPAVHELAAEAELGEVPEPFRQWYQKKVDRYSERATRRGVRGALVRQLYRSPVDCDPDAVVLAGLDLNDFLDKKTFRR